MSALKTGSAALLGVVGLGALGMSVAAVSSLNASARAPVVRPIALRPFPGVQAAPTPTAVAPPTPPVAAPEPPKPAEVAPKPAEVAPKPAEPAPKPAEVAPKPAEPAPKPAEPAPKPAEPAPKPAEVAPKPAEPAPKPAEVAPKPAEPAPKPVAAKPPAPKAADAEPKAEVFGTLSLKASDTADVFVDGKKVGTSPLNGFKVKVGPHKVRFDCLDASGAPQKGELQIVVVEADQTSDVDYTCAAE